MAPSAFELEVPGYGPKPSKIMFVGISGGRLGALITKVPFTRGPAGRLFQRTLGKLGLSESDERSEAPVLRCYVTNLVKGVCLTEKGMNRLPTIKEIEFWWPHFYREFEEVRPEIVIAMGDLVYRTLCRKGVRARMVKHPRWYESHGAISNNASYDKMLRDYEEAVRSS